MAMACLMVRLSWVPFPGQSYSLECRLNIIRQPDKDRPQFFNAIFLRAKNSAKNEISFLRSLSGGMLIFKTSTR